MVKRDKRIEFNLITTRSKCEKVMKFLEENIEYDECIKNVCIYCMNVEKQRFLKTKYLKIHDDIDNKANDIANFINKGSNENIKSFPLTKLITYEIIQKNIKKDTFKYQNYMEILIQKFIKIQLRI